MMTDSDITVSQIFWHHYAWFPSSHVNMSMESAQKKKKFQGLLRVRVHPINYAYSLQFLCVFLRLKVDFTHIFHGRFTVTGAIIWLPQWQWNNLEKYG